MPPSPRALVPGRDHGGRPGGSQDGWILDYGEIKEAAEPLRVRLDHHYLNEIEGLENATSEVLCAWIWERLEPALPSLACVAVEETCTARCEYWG